MASIASSVGFNQIAVSGTTATITVSLPNVQPGSIYVFVNVGTGNYSTGIATINSVSDSAGNNYSLPNGSLYFSDQDMPATFLGRVADGVNAASNLTITIKIVNTVWMQGGSNQFSNTLISGVVANIVGTANPSFDQSSIYFQYYGIGDQGPGATNIYINTSQQNQLAFAVIVPNNSGQYYGFGNLVVSGGTQLFSNAPNNPNYPNFGVWYNTPPTSGNNNVITTVASAVQGGTSVIDVLVFGVLNAAPITGTIGPQQPGTVPNPQHQPVVLNQGAVLNTPTATTNIPIHNSRNTSQSGPVNKKTSITCGISNAKLIQKKTANGKPPSNANYAVPNPEPAAGFFSILPVTGPDNINVVLPASGAYGPGYFLSDQNGVARAITALQFGALQSFTGKQMQQASAAASAASSLINAVLFSGTMHLLLVNFNTGSTNQLQQTDIQTILQFMNSITPVQVEYDSQWGTCSNNVDQTIYNVTLNLSGTSFNDATLSGNPGEGENVPATGGFVDNLVAQMGWQNGGPSAHCVVIIAPPGVLNTDCNPANGYLGYHSASYVYNVPYIYVPITQNGLSSNDLSDLYQIALSHEIAEMIVDPAANLANPEVCDSCLPPDTLILGDNKLISEYNIGDHVISENGLLHVSKVYSRDYTGDLIEIKALGMLPFRATETHNIWIVQRGKWKNNDVGYTYTNIGRKAARLIQPRLTRNDGDYLVMPKIKGIFDTTSIGLGIPLNTDTAWLLGLYVAKGSMSSYGVAKLSINIQEEHLYSKVKNICSNIGINEVRFEQQTPEWKSANITIKHEHIGELFQKLCGHGASNKHIPEFILYHKDEEILKSFLNGYLAGDGYTYKTNIPYEAIEFKTVSKLLITQLQLAYGRLGIFLPLREGLPDREEIIDGRIVHAKQQYRASYIQGDQKRSRLVGDNYYLPVEEVKRIPYSGKVYNLKTDCVTNEPSFLVVNVVVSGNCASVIGCGPNCQMVIRNFFDNTGAYITSSAFFQSGIGPGFTYAFMSNSVSQPPYATTAANTCPNLPYNSCAYSPPGGSISQLNNPVGQILNEFAQISGFAPINIVPLIYQIPSIGTGGIIALPLASFPISSIPQLPTPASVPNATSLFADHVSTGSVQNPTVPPVAALASGLQIQTPVLKFPWQGGQ
jgi:intein/homing endonuclease